MRTPWTKFFVLAAVLAVGAPALAADPPVGDRVAAVVKSADAHTLQATTPEGKSLSVALADDLKVMRNADANLSDVKSGLFIGCTAVEGADKKLVAQEIHIFPESLRGSGEGHYPFGDQPMTTMTNGEIAQLSGVTDGKVVKVTYKGGQSDIVIPPDVKVTRIEQVGRELLKPGTNVMVFVPKDGPAHFISITHAPATP